MKLKFGVKKLKKSDKVFFNSPLISKNYFLYGKNLNQLANKNNVTVISGRCPSKKINLVHLLTFKALANIQKHFNWEIIIPIGFSEYFFKKNINLENINKIVLKNIKSILSMGLSKDKTIFLIDKEQINSDLFLTLQLCFKNIKINELFNIFGEKYFQNSGLIFSSVLEVVQIIQPILNNNYSLLVSPLSQDVFFRLAKKVLGKGMSKKLCALYNRVILDLKGGLRWDSSPNGALYIEDGLNIIKKKINSAFTGGKDNKFDQKKSGGNPSICPIYEYFYLFNNEKKSSELKNKCKKGKILCGECKNALYNTIKIFLNNYKESYAKLKDIKLNDINWR